MNNKKQKNYSEETEDNSSLTEFSRKQREKMKDQRIKEQRRSKNERKTTACVESYGFYF